VQEARRGTKVAPLEFEQLEEIQAVRSGIECLAVRVGINALDPDRLAVMEERLRELVDVAGDDDLGRYLESEWRFRETCLAASGRARLLSLIADYRNRAARYLRVAFAGPGGLGDSLAFQDALLDACRRGDGERAEVVIREALEWTVRAVRPFFAGGTGAEKPRRARREPAQPRLAK
jgi:DNA-binding GntR family transcriptional regulator